MNYEVIITPQFSKEAKKLLKKHRSLLNDLQNLIASLEERPTQGSQIQENCYKIRMAITSKGKGKSSGARVITWVHLIGEKVFLLSIYDKSEKENIALSHLNTLVDMVNDIVTKNNSKEEE